MGWWVGPAALPGSHCGSGGNGSRIGAGAAGTGVAFPERPPRPPAGDRSSEPGAPERSQRTPAGPLRADSLQSPPDRGSTRPRPLLAALTLHPFSQGLPKVCSRDADVAAGAPGDVQPQPMGARLRGQPEAHPRVHSAGQGAGREVQGRGRRWSCKAAAAA
eukprot:350682-Chlamydomonas_euryale.AAC.5